MAEGLKTRNIDQSLAALQKKEKRVLSNFENLLMEGRMMTSR